MATTPPDATALPPVADSSLADFLSAATRRPIGPATHAVLGNEAADLDSVASAIVWASVLAATQPTVHALPVVNVRRAELPLRRDVQLALTLSGLSSDQLMFRDSLDLADCAALSLVDHNALPAPDVALAPRVRALLDHHADEGAHADARPRVVEPVGSCATLVAERAAAAGVALGAASSRLLLGAVLMDCHDMDPAVGKATARDAAVADALCLTAGLDATERRTLFKTLKRARKDISGMSAYDLMRKDAKVVRGVPFSVAICSIGVSPAELAERAARDGGLCASERRFAREWGVDHAIMMAGFGGAGGFERNVVVPRGDGGAETVRLDSFVSALVRAGERIGLEEATDSAAIDGFVVLRQRDTKASRKQVLPIVRSVLDGKL